jgi:hypothetical protein
VEQGLIGIERAALRRIGERAVPIALALFAAEVAGLGLWAAVARMHHAALGWSLVGVALALQWLLSLGGLAIALAAVAIARPLTGGALALPVLRASVALGAILLLGALVDAASTLGLLAVLPRLAAHSDGLGRAAVLALAVTPILFVLGLLAASCLAGTALVGRGLAAGRALTLGMDHVLRRPGRALALLSLHAVATVVLLGIALVSGVPALLAPVAVVLGTTLAVAAFDAALGRDARLTTG